MSELQLQKPKGNNKWTLAIIAGAVIVMAIAAFLILSGKNKTTDYTLIPVSNDGERWGYVNLKGEYVINPQFEDADYFNNDLAKITSADGKTGYINKKGEYVIPATYKSGTVFNDGLAFVVAEGGLPTCIDKKGNTKFALNVARYVSPFSEGMAMFVAETGEYGFVDRSGNIVINAQFSKALPFSGNYASIRQNDNMGFIDKKGSITINPQFNEVGNFSEGKAAFYNGNSWGYIDQKGSYIVNPMFDNANRFSDGLAAIKQGRAYGYIDKNGKLVVNPQFDNGSPFSDGLAAVQGAGKYGYINKDGKYEINPQFEYAGDFHGGIAMVRSGDKWGFINKKGQYVVNPQFKHVKFEVSPDARPDLIESDYYDTSEFIALFFERDAGNTFDGIGTSTTLAQLSEHPVYGAGLNARTSSNADFHQRIPITNDILISDVTFLFGNTPIYEYVNEGYRRTQKWNFDAMPDAIAYQFSLNGKAWEKRHVVINSLKSEIERRYGNPMVKNDENYYLSPENGKFGFSIEGHTLMVIFYKNQQQQLAQAKKECEDFLASIEATEKNVMKTPSGLLYKIIREGSERATNDTDVVIVNYTGMLPNGEEFDSSKGDPASFQLNHVIQGWAEGMKLVGKGGKIKLWIPPKLAYGSDSDTPDPHSPGGGNQILIFDIEVLDVKPAI